ncbi:MAG: DnaB-like helicase C-terminal domain-containing protein, partial [Porticoccaceae bacterium]
DSMGAAGEQPDLGYLNALTANTPSAANIGRYADIVREKALLRGMLRAANVVHEIVAGALPAAEKLDLAQAEFGKLAETTIRKDPTPIREALGRYIEILDDRVQGLAQNPGIPTGLVDLDEYLNGGIRRGALAVIGARPGMGKSALGETVALNAAIAGYGALFLSMEMPEAEVTERAIANVGRISATVLARAERDLGAADGWARVTAAVQQLESVSLFIDDDPGLSLLQVVTKARAVKRKAGLDLLVVDYLQLMTGPEEKRYQQIEAITKGLKILAKTLNIGVLALSQLNRDVEKRVNKRPIMADFRDGGSIEQDSDILLGLYREEQDKPDTQYKGYAELHLLKNRQGTIGTVPLTYLGEQLRFASHAGPVPEFSYSKRQSRGFED